MTGYNTIVFFGRTLKINPVAFCIGPKPIYWYALIIAAGFLLAVVYAMSEARRTGFSQDDIVNVVLIGMPSAIICARAYYVIFSWESYKGNFLEMIAIWHGGIAIYGALIGALAAGLIYCRVKKISFKKLLDIACGSFFIGQSIGRWGNFVNSEAYGRETLLPWKMGVYEAGRLIFVHPTFLYESLWNAAGFLILLIFRKHKKYDGQLFLFYILWYGTGRAWIEGLRTDSLYMGSIRVSQLVAAVCAVTGAVLLIYNGIKRKNQP